MLLLLLPLFILGEKTKRAPRYIYALFIVILRHGCPGAVEIGAVREEGLRDSLDPGPEHCSDREGLLASQRVRPDWHQETSNSVEGMGQVRRELAS